MNDLETLRRMQPGPREIYREAIIDLVADKHTEAITMSPRDTVGYIMAVESEELRKLSWDGLVQELTFVVDDTDEFTLADLGE